jgi:RimJ/RimL family protein N-acetyltransferase
MTRLEELHLRTLDARDTSELIRIRSEPAVRRWWGAVEEDFPWDEPEATRWTVLLGSAVVGMVQFTEETEPRYRHAGIDIFLDPAVHGAGVGTEVVRRVVAHLIEDRGHHRITIDPALANLAAIRAYEKAGFRRVGVMRSYERDAEGERWHDGLLMELLAGDLAAGP